MPKKKVEEKKKSAKPSRESLPRAARDKKRSEDGLFDAPTAPEPPKEKKKKAKAKKKKVTRKTKPTYAVMIRRAIEHYNHRDGSSLFAIYKYLEDNYPVSDTFHRYVRHALKEGLASGIFKRIRMSYRVTKKGRAKLSGGARKAKKKVIKKKKAADKKKKGDGSKKRKKPAEKKKKSADKKKKKAPAKKKAKADDSGEKEKEKDPPKRGAAKKIEAAASPAKKLFVSPAGYKFRWQYMDGSWKDYEANASDVVETAYQHYVKNPGMCDVRAVKSGQWQYQVDFLNMKQTNIQHENHTTRAIRRLPLNE